MNKRSFRNPLYISLAVIFLIWLQEIVRSIYFPNQIQSLYTSIPNFLLTAFIIGILYVLVVVLLLRFSKEPMRDLGFSGQQVARQIRNGILFGLAIFILHTFLITPLVDSFLPKTAAEGIDMKELFSHAVMLPILIVLTAFKGGFSEELWRMFYISRFQKFCGKTGLLLSVIFGSVVFGLGHAYQGTGAIISTAIVGLMYALIYLRKRMALEPIIAHAVDDLVAVVVGFIIYSNG